MEPGVFFYWFFIYWGTWSENNHLHIDEPIGCDEVKNHFRLQRKRGRPRKDNSRTTDRDPDYKPDATVINATDSKSSAHGDKAKVCCFLSPLIIQTTMSLVRLITGWSFSRHLCMMTLSHVTHSWQWVRSTWYDSCCNAARAVPLQEPKDALNDAPILQWLMVTSHTLSVVIARSAFSSYPPPSPCPSTSPLTGFSDRFRTSVGRVALPNSSHLKLYCQICRIRTRHFPNLRIVHSTACRWHIVSVPKHCPSITKTKTWTFWLPNLLRTKSPLLSDLLNPLLTSQPNLTL